MTDDACNRWLGATNPHGRRHGGPKVTVDGSAVRISDDRGGVMCMADWTSNMLRSLAHQLAMTADEIDRRNFEDRVADSDERSHGGGK